MKRKIRNFKHHLAFTLVELIIVIAIITLLAGIVIVVIQPQSIFQNARNTQRNNDLSTLQNAINRYIGESPINSTQRSLNDIGNYGPITTSNTLLYNATQPTPTGNCPNGSSGQNLTGGFAIDNTGVAGTLDFSILINKGYLTKLIKDPNNANYYACIDTFNGNSLVIYAPLTEGNVSITYNLAGPVVSFKPNDISGILLWLDATQINDYSDGQNVSTWKDLSGTGNNAFQITPSNQPTFNKYGLNNKSSISFNGTSQYFNLTSSGALINNYSIIAVYNRTNHTGQAPFYSNRASSDLYVGTKNSNSFIYKNILTPPSLFGSTSLINNESYLQENYFSSSSRAIYLNGNLNASDSPTGTFTSLIPAGWVGYDSAAPNYWNGQISEMIIYNSTLSNSDRQRIEYYLNKKYSIY